MAYSDVQARTLKVIILSQLLIEANDDIKNTDMYKGKLKVFGRQYINQLGNAIKQTDAVYGAQPEVYHNILNNIEQLCEKLAKCDVHDLVMINQIHKHYSEHKEDWNAMFEVELEKLKS